MKYRDLVAIDEAAYRVGLKPLAIETTSFPGASPNHRLGIRGYAARGLPWKGNCLVDDKTQSFLEELVSMIARTQCEVDALREILVDQKMFSEEEFAKRIEDARNKHFLALKTEFQRRAFEKALKDRPTQ